MAVGEFPRKLNVTFHCPYGMLTVGAPMKCYAACLFFGLQGGGLYIQGTATLINSNVYENEAWEYVCSLFEPSGIHPPSPR